MQDRQTESTWSHITGRAIDGQAKGAQLEKLASIETTWSRWRAEHPETSVLKKSEVVRSSHYQSYFENPDRLGLFRAQWLMDRMPGKTLVFGATVGPHAVAATDGAFEEGGLVNVELGGTPVVMSRGDDGGVRGWVANIEGGELKLVVNSKTGETVDDTGSEWDLVSGRCVAGPNVGSILETVAVTPIYWFAWSNYYPNTKVVDRPAP